MRIQPPTTSPVGETEISRALRANDEFFPDASVWPEGLSRRDFLKVMGASLALAGLGACNRQPTKEIVPYTVPPEAGYSPEAIYYASAFSFEGYARGILVEAHQGRPTKIEGNPRHPDSLGATDIFTQASVLSLYDPDRSRVPRRNSQPTTWLDFDEMWRQRRNELETNRGDGLTFLTEPTSSPTVLAQIHALLDTFPSARWFQHSALPRYDRFGRQLDYQVADADVILAVDCDFLIQHPAALRYSRSFAQRRRTQSGKLSANRLYAIEPALSITGSMADARLAAHPAAIPTLLEDLGTLVANANAPIPSGRTDAQKGFLSALARDLRTSSPRVLIAVGPTQPDPVHAWADALHRRLRAYGVTVFTLPAIRSDADPRSAGNLVSLAQAIEAQEVKTLVIAGANPVYTAPADLGFADKLKRVPHTIHFGTHFDETAARCVWHAPQSHYLESWSDLRAYDGSVSIVQPLIEPLYGTRSEAEFLAGLTRATAPEGYELVRATWHNHGDPHAFETNWRRWLDQGLIDSTAETRNAQPVGSGEPPRLATAAASDALVLLLRQDYTIGDGGGANNGWLQELPKPFTHVVWDNALFVSHAFQKKLHVEDGDLVELRTPQGTLRLPVWAIHGQLDTVLLLHLGYGRTEAGEVGNRRGVNAYLVQHSGSPATSPVLEIRKVDGRAKIVSTHNHFSMEQRDLVRVVKASELDRVERERPSGMSLYPEPNYQGYAWAMSIDLSTCTGCNACVIACQAENNIPVVGKDQVQRGREMHWIRIDRYYDGPEENPRALHQPVPCMQCEYAPCELVCPVGATVHSSEGLNDMVYNRCVGTRYCSNNCPYKVRRFNFLDYRPPSGSPVYLQANPDVTVRSRGVMEKCTYCVQRINAARIRAERENRRVHDGEIQTACQQACPVEAIVFGDLSDRGSRVNQRKHEPTNYSLLAELNTRPRTTYLARVLNLPEESAHVS